MTKLYAILAATALTGGSLFALQHTFNSEKVQLNQLPAAAQQAIKSHAGNAQVQDIDKETFDGFTTYQAAFNKGGKHEELRVDAQGHVWGAQWKQIPPAVEQTAEQNIGNNQLLGFRKVAANGGQVYHFRYNQNGTPKDLWISAAGKAIARPGGITEAAGAENINSTIEGAGANATTSGQTVNQSTIQQSTTTQTTAGAQWIEFKDLPWPVQQTIMNQAGGVNVPRVRKTADQNGQTVYRVGFNENGQRTHIAVAQDGTLLNTTSGAGIGLGDTGETATTPLSGASKVNFNDLPQQVKNAITSQANGAAIEDVDKGTVNGQTVYEAAFKRNGKTFELQVKEDGTVLGGHFD